VTPRNEKHAELYNAVCDSLNELTANLVAETGGVLMPADTGRAFISVGIFTLASATSRAFAAEYLRHAATQLEATAQPADLN